MSLDLDKKSTIDLLQNVYNLLKNEDDVTDQKLNIKTNHYDTGDDYYIDINNISFCFNCKNHLSIRFNKSFLYLSFTSNEGNIGKYKKLDKPQEEEIIYKQLELFEKLYNEYVENLLDSVLTDLELLQKQPIEVSKNLVAPETTELSKTKPFNLSLSIARWSIFTIIFSIPMISAGLPSSFFLAAVIFGFICEAIIGRTKPKQLQEKPKTYKQFQIEEDAALTKDIENLSRPIRKSV